MDTISDLDLLKECCRENPNEYKLIVDLLRLEKRVSLQLRQRSIQAEAETTMDNYFKRKML